MYNIEYIKMVLSLAIYHVYDIILLLLGTVKHNIIL